MRKFFDSVQCPLWTQNSLRIPLAGLLLCLGFFSTPLNAATCREVLASYAKSVGSGLGAFLLGNHSTEERGHTQRNHRLKIHGKKRRKQQLLIDELIQLSPELASVQDLFAATPLKKELTTRGMEWRGQWFGTEFLLRQNYDPLGPTGAWSADIVLRWDNLGEREMRWRVLKNRVRLILSELTGINQFRETAHVDISSRASVDHIQFTRVDQDLAPNQALANRGFLFFTNGAHLRAQFRHNQGSPAEDAYLFRLESPASQSVAQLVENVYAITHRLHDFQVRLSPGLEAFE